MVLGVFLGSRPSGCYSVMIDNVYMQDGVVWVKYREEVPGAEAICSQALTSPSHLVAIRRTTRPVRFIKAF
jgi:hypothetical protein